MLGSMPSGVVGSISSAVSTTANADLHRVAAFSPIIFVDGTRLLVRRGSKLRGYGDMTGKTLVVIAGTRAKQVMGYLVEQRRLTARTVTVPDADQALAMLHDGRADAIASDDVELHRLVAENKGTGQVSMVGGFLSQEPYAIMFAKDDPPLAGAVGRGFARMAHDGDLFRIYGRWFQRTAARRSCAALAHEHLSVGGFPPSQRPGVNAPLQSNGSPT